MAALAFVVFIAVVAVALLLFVSLTDSERRKHRRAGRVAIVVTVVVSGHLGPGEWCGYAIRTVVSADGSGCHVPELAVHRCPAKVIVVMS